MPLSWLLWLSLVVGVVVGCVWVSRARVGLWLTRARVPARQRPLEPAKWTSPVLDVQNERSVSGWQVRTSIRPRRPARDDSPPAAPLREPGTE